MFIPVLVVCSNDKMSHGSCMAFNANDDFKDTPLPPKRTPSLFHKFPTEVTDMVYLGVSEGLAYPSTRPSRVTLSALGYDSLAAFDVYLYETNVACTMRTCHPREFPGRYRRRRRSFDDDFFAAFDSDVTHKGGLSTRNFYSDLDWALQHQISLPYILARSKNPNIPVTLEYCTHTADILGMVYYDAVLSQSPQYDMTTHWKLFLLLDPGFYSGCFFAQTKLAEIFFSDNGIVMRDTKAQSSFIKTLIDERNLVSRLFSGGLAFQQFR